MGLRGFKGAFQVGSEAFMRASEEIQRIFRAVSKRLKRIAGAFMRFHKGVRGIHGDSQAFG